jgi:two-component system response regulator NreC
VPAHIHLAAVGSGTEGWDRPELPILVVLAEDHPRMRRSLRRLLDGEKDVKVVAEVADLSRVMPCVHRHMPHVLVLDLQTPKGSSLELIKQLRAGAPATEIVVVTMEARPLSAQRAIDAGAVGFVLKDKADTELPVAVRTAAEGGDFVSPHVAAGLDALRRAVSGDGLSPRETEVLRLIALGHTNAEIAAMLHHSRRAVETQRADIHRRLGLTTRAQLVHYALRRHLIGA